MRLIHQSIIIFLTIIGLSLIIPHSSLGQSDIGNSSAVKIPISDCFYRLDNSGLDDKGLPLWIYEDISMAEWEPIKSPSVLQKKLQEHNTLWLLILPPEGDWKSPAILVPPLFQGIEIYRNYQLIYAFGEFVPSDVNKYSAYKWHHIPLHGLAARFESNALFLKAYSNSPGDIATQNFHNLWFGSQAQLIKVMSRIGAEYFILGLVSIGAGLLSIFIYFRRREQKQYIVLSFGAFVFFVGIGELTGSSITQLLIDRPSLLYCGSYSFLFYPAAYYIFCEHLFGRGYKNLIRRLWQAQIIFALIAFCLDLANIYPVLHTMRMQFGLLVFGLCVLVPTAIKAARKGNFEARIFIMGMGIMMLFGIHDILMGLGLFPEWHWISGWGVLIFIIFLAYILEYRFAQAHRKLEEYSLTLEQKVEDRTQELREAQSQMVMQSKMASLGDLVAGVAHEMNNPIGVIHSAADTANRGIGKLRNLLTADQSNRKLAQNLNLLETNHKTISEASDRISGIVESLRSFATLDEALFQQVDIHENIDTTLTLMQHELKNKVAVIKEYGDIPKIQCYPNELNQVFMNLLRNAIQAIDQQGAIRISTYADNKQIFIKIADTGSGISPEYLSRIYDPGFTTQSEGVGKGLGLSIVYNIVQKHNGNIEINSEVGKGTEVTITLPVKQ